MRTSTRWMAVPAISGSARSSTRRLSFRRARQGRQGSPHVHGIDLDAAADGRRKKWNEPACLAVPLQPHQARVPEGRRKADSDHVGPSVDDMHDLEGYVTETDDTTHLGGSLFRVA